MRVEGRGVDVDRLRGELRGMVAKWEPVLRFASEYLLRHPFSAWRVLRNGWRHLYKLRGTVASELSRALSDQAVRDALAGMMLYSGVPPDQAPIVSILGLIAMMTEGFYLPEGGMGSIPQALNCALKSNGGKVFLESKVEKIVIKDGHVCGVDVQRHGRIDTGCVISTVSPMLMFSTLIDAEHVPSAMRRKLRRARLSHRAVSLQFGASNTIHARSHLTTVLPPMERQGEIFTQDAQTVTWPTFFVPTLTMPELASNGCVIEMFHPVRQDVALDDWDENRKEQLTASAIRALKQHHDLDIAVTRVRTPRDFRDGMNLYDGAVYGLSPASGPTEYFAQRTPVRGLYLAGQCTYPGYGVAASVMSGIFAAEALLS